MELGRIMGRVVVVVAALLAPAIGCQVFGGRGAASTSPPPSHRGIDEPPPLHTGGLAVMSSEQAPGSSPGSRGDPVAEGIATGIGVVTIGATAARTAGLCAQPDASPTCLRGPGPVDNERDGGR